MNKKVNTKQTIPYIMLIAIIAVVLIMFSFSGSTVKELTYDELITFPFSIRKKHEFPFA